MKIPKLLLLVSVVFAPAALIPASSAQTPTPDQAAPTNPPAATATPPRSGVSADQTPSSPQPTHQLRIPELGVDLGIFIPTASKTRNRFGSVWTSVGLGIGKIDKPGTGRFGLDIGLTGVTNGSNYAYILPVGVSYRRALFSSDLTNGQAFIPYFGVSADVVGVDLNSPKDNVHSDVEVAGGGSLSLGTTIGRRAFAEARYAEISEVKGFDLSGLGLTVGIRF